MKVIIIFACRMLILATLATASDPNDCCEKVAGRDDFYRDVFPKDFVWGLASSSYQIEGAWNKDGKGKSMWDKYVHRKPSPIADGSTGDITCDSYHRYKEDVAALKKIGANFYRFSISWPRILPTGRLDHVNEKGLEYYDKLINELLANDIHPFVTIFHWDLPQQLEQQNQGWLSEKTAEDYANYARFVFEKFGNRVKKWITFNEVYIFCILGYSGYNSLLSAAGLSPTDFQLFAPARNMSATGPYLCAHNQIKAHGLAYRIYENEFKQDQGGEVGMTILGEWYEPRDGNNAEDVAASQRYLDFSYGWILSPLITGRYPEIMRKLIDEKSRQEGCSESRLPQFNSTWRKILKGSVDFVGINHYSTRLTSPFYGTTADSPNPYNDADVTLTVDPRWATSASPLNRVVPWGIRRILTYTARRYGRIPLYITENGFAEDATGGIHDPGRINFYNLYINEVLKAVKIDGVNVKGYTAWALLDNFEWTSGFTARYGVHYIDFAGGNLTRVRKDSARFLQKVFRNNGFP